MKKTIFYIAILIFLASCNQQEILLVESTDAVEQQGVDAEIAGGATTRAAALDANNYVGRSVFIDKDQMVLTMLKRTVSAIPGFTYTGIVYNQEIEEGQTSGGWSRDKEKGCTEASEAHPERIYWSDATNDHTYIGYSLPQQLTGTTFDWNLKNAYYNGSGTTSVPVYYGSLGSPTSSTETYIDYANDDSDTGEKDEPENANSAVSHKSGNEKLKHDDLLLTWDNKKVAETGGSVAKLYYHHALAMVRVIVNIQGFSASTDAADSKSVVTDMVLKDMRTLYKWRQQDYCAEALEETYDAGNVEAIYGHGVTFDQKKDTHLWIPRTSGTGTGVGKQFTFYGLAVPYTMGVNNATTTDDVAKNLHLAFKVHYQDPMNPWLDPATKQNPNMKDHEYTAVMPDQIEFRAGHCTTINITLNHSNEKMTIGAEYMDWQHVETPDQGELKKNSTFLSYIPTSEEDRIANKIYIADDEQATPDDATWLYKEDDGTVLDIYGNDGTTEAKAYTISTANQLLSFAYEVKSGRTFENRYVKLDADIVMQKDVSSSDVTWIGIGDATHAFYGTFNGGGRNISFLKGSPFFHTLEQLSVVDKVNLSNIISINGDGAIANISHYGLICCCNIDGDIDGNIDDSSSTDTYCGSIVGDNNGGMIVGCSHVGSINSSAQKVGGIVGRNNGTIVASYHSGTVESSSANPDVHAAIACYDVGSSLQLPSYACSAYFNSDYNYSSRPLTEAKTAFNLTTAFMQSNAFVNGTGDILSHSHTAWTETHYSLNVALQKFVEEMSHITIGSNGWSSFLSITLSQSGKEKFLNHFATTADGGTTWTLRNDHKFVYSAGDYPKTR